MKLSIDAFIAALSADFEYSYVTVYKNERAVCEGFLKTLQKTVNLSALQLRSYYVLEAEDGSVFVDLYT